MIVALNERTNETQIKEKVVVVLKTREVLEWGQAVLLLLFWNTASLSFFSLIRWGSLPKLSWEKRIFFFICVCLFVASRIDSRLLVFRIRLPVTLSVKGEKKKGRRNPTWRNHTSLKKKQLISVASTKKAKFYFSRRIRIDGWARLVEKRK